MGMDIWGMYNGCRMESKEFVYPILRIDYDIINNDSNGKKFNNVKIIRNSSLISLGQGLRNSVYVRLASENKLRVGDFEWLNIRGFNNIRVEVLELVTVNYDVPVFSNVNDSLWEASQFYHDKELINIINWFNELYYSDRTAVLNFADNFEVNEMSLNWWTNGHSDFVYNNTSVELDQDEIDYLIQSINDFRTLDKFRDGAYSRFFDELRADVLTNRTSYVIDAS